MNRRKLLAGAAGAMAGTTLAIGGAVAKVRQVGEATPAPDAELIAVCTEFDTLERQSCIIHGTGPDCVPDDDEANRVSGPIFARMHVLLDRMDELRATAPAGIQARAHSLALHGGHGQYSFDCADSMVGRLLYLLMRDSAALGAAVAGVAVVASPDAELVAACQGFDAWEWTYLATGFDHKPGSLEAAEASAEQDRCHQEQAPLVSRMCELRATTHEGMAARARSLALWDEELMKVDGSNFVGDRLTAAIVRDLIGQTT